METNNKHDYSFEEDARRGLADYLKLSDDEIKDIKYDGNHTFAFGDKEWFVYENYDKAYDDAVDSVRSFMLMENPSVMISWDKMPGGMEAYIDTKWFAAVMREDYEFYVNEIRNESASSNEYSNRLSEEMAENGCKTEAEYIEKLCSGWDSPLKWYIDNYGENSLGSVAKEHGMLDVDKAAEAVVDIDGVEYHLVCCDKVVHLANGFLAYRVN